MNSLDDESVQALVAAARAVQTAAYAPYSGFRVGAALRSASGQIYVGCNVENASYGATLCAERAAVASLIAASEREIVAVAVYTDSDQLAMPCGVCRQVLCEFGCDALVIVANETALQQTSIAALLPEPFVLKR